MEYHSFLPAFIIIWDKVRKNSIEIGTDGSNLYYKCSLKTNDNLCSILLFVYLRTIK